MRVLTRPLGAVLHRVRIAVKGCAYSGLARQRWQHPERVLEALAPASGARVADLGAGAGYFTVRLARRVGPEGRVYAVDTDPDMTAAITRRAEGAGLRNVAVVEALPHDPGLPEPVDLALLVNALHHLPEPDDYLARLTEYVRPGGQVAVIEALPAWFLFGHATEPERIRSLLIGAGYALVAEHEFLPRQSFLVFERGA